MIFYIALGGLFTLYAVDLLGLVIISAFARGAEIRAALAKKREKKREQRKKDVETKAQKFAFGNEGMVSSGIKAVKERQVLKPHEAQPATENANADNSPASPPSTPLAPPVPSLSAPRLASTTSNVSELTLNDCSSPPPESNTPDCYSDSYDGNASQQDCNQQQEDPLQIPVKNPLHAIRTSSYQPDPVSKDVEVVPGKLYSDPSVASTMYDG